MLTGARGKTQQVMAVLPVSESVIIFSRMKGVRLRSFSSSVGDVGKEILITTPVWDN